GWDLGVPTGHAAARGRTALEAFAAARDDDWIVNSRNTADEEVVRTLASLAGFAPRVVHRADSLDLVQDMVVEGLGVGLLPSDQPTRPGVSLVSLREPEVTLRAYAVTRAGRSGWPPLALVLRLLEGHPVA
ncbi:MAG: LysR substrate-binding domain-containing protein, partial [Nocardioides sp.]